ncbi:hypothetical protein KFE98_14115 [bacterium SCSIO 12741]|nr:hypothetical protein KFE98_14115 [bacterium SCSIO 12741]
MKKGFVFLLVLAVILGVAAWILGGKNNSTIQSQLTDFAIEDTGAVTKVFLADKANRTLTVERTENGWMVNGDIKARQDVVNVLLSTLKNIKVRTPVSKAQFDLVVKKLAAKSTKVEVYSNYQDVPTKVYFVGGANAEHTGTYMLLDNSTVPFLMHIEGHYGYLGPRYPTNPNLWQDNSIWSYPGELVKTISSIKLEHVQEPGKSFEIVKNGEESYLLKDANGNVVPDANQAIIRDYVIRFKQISYEGREETKSQQFLDSLQIGSPVQHVFTVTDESGNKTEVATYKKPVPEGYQDFEQQILDYDMDRMYISINGEGLVIAQYFVFDPLTAPLSFFRGTPTP